MSKYLIIPILLLLLAPSLSANQKIVGHMAPLDDELLSPALTLKKDCAGVAIREWRPSVNKDNTQPSRRAAKMMSEVCNLAVDHFDKYVREKGYTPRSLAKFRFNISLIPFDAYDDGTQYRNLNDISYRFAKRFRTIDQDGNPSHILGYTSRAGDDYVYLRNDPLTPNWKENPRFKVVFAHELYHAMSFRYGVWDQMGGDSNQEEEMAYGFTESLGLGR